MSSLHRLLPKQGQRSINSVNIGMDVLIDELMRGR